MSKVTDWLKDEGVKIGIALLVGILMYIGWRIITYFMIKGFIKSGIKSREISRKTLTKSSGILSVVVDDMQELTEDEKNQIEARSKTIGGVIRSVGTSIIVLIVSIQILDAIGVPTTSLLTGAAIFGLAIAFALQTLVGDFASGLFILLDGSYNVGDIVTINGITAVIERLTLRITTMRGLDGTLVTVPNGDIRVIQNHSRDYNVHVSNVGITYESDLKKCVEILNTDVVDKVEKDERLKGVILAKPVVDGIGQLADSSVNIRFVVKCKAGTRVLVDRVCNEYIHEFLGSELAYPTTRIVKN